jgi:hypothetical protein
MKPYLFSLIVLVSLFAMQSAFATNLRCGTRLLPSGLPIGVTQYEVIKACGEPIAKNGNRWIMVRPGERIKILVFDAAGQLAAIHKR